jgi:hypothetical protein
MPFVYDETQIEWPDDHSEPPLPRADQFMYLSPPEFAGVTEPVRFYIEPVTDVAEGVLRRRRYVWESMPEKLAETLPGIMLHMLLSRRRSLEEEVREQSRRHEERRQRFFSVAIPELRNAGARLVYCRYDGGGDEGSCWLDGVEMRDGQQIHISPLIPLLLDARLVEKLTAVNVLPFHGYPFTDSLARRRYNARPDQQKLEEVLRDLCNEWGSMLLGGAFGTGELSLYGAFAVDLETCTIIDDRHAEPIVRNIQIAR